MTRILTLGCLAVRGADGHPLAGAAAQPRRMAVLAILARAGERGVSREKLLALLWPDADDERGPRNLTQAVYALRRDLGSDDSIGGTKELRLNSSMVSSDVAEFVAAVSRSDDERAVVLYAGPFLDGFHLADADLFTRWVEQERSTLAHDNARALESLARAASARGDGTAAIGWWRKLAALDPLNARITVGLMEALAAAGDRALALQHARVYEALLEQEFDLPPDREVIALAARLRSDADAAQVTPRAQPPVPAERPVLLPSAVEPRGEAVEATPALREPTRSAATTRRAAALALGAIALAAIAATWRTRSHPSADDAQPVIAVGRIVDYGTASGAGVGGALRDMIGTDLARAPGLRVVSTARMYELVEQLGGRAQDTSLGIVMTAARRAGASEVLDGSLYQLGGGRLRLDLRRIDVATGGVLHADQVEAGDIFVLADSGALRIVKEFGMAEPRGSLADVTTRSAVAYRLYADGLREFFAGAREHAEAQFTAALVEDSMFAMAAYYRALAARPDGFPDPERLAKALRLSATASDRERLIIRTAWSAVISSPSARLFAESLAVRYPDEVEGHVFLGQALIAAGEFLTAIPQLEHVVAMDSLGLRTSRANCMACHALELIVTAYAHADSLDAAERVARSWVARQPLSPKPNQVLAQLLEFEGRWSDALAQYAKRAALGGLVNVGLGEDDAGLLIRSLDVAALDRRLAERSRAGSADALIWFALSMRVQGRLDEALAAAQRLRGSGESRQAAAGAAPYDALVLAQTLFDRGEFRASAALFDSIARGGLPSSEPSTLARRRVWFLTHVADARAAAGDTAGLSALADSIEALGAQSGSGRDQRLHHHVRGLLLAARGRHADAAREFRLSVYSLTQGLTRTNLNLARELLAMGKSREAVDVLRPALHGPLDGANLYVTHTEVHEMLGRAWERAGNADSAAVHYAYVARAWSKADASLTARAAEARTKSVVRRRG